MSARLWPILPAAGVGSRMQADRPKQYLLLQNRYLIDHTLKVMLSYPRFEHVVLVLSKEDPYWEHSEYFNNARIVRADGGSERCYSVLNGLHALNNVADENDWVFVHDVARPCLQHSDLDKLCSALNDSGAILATPVRDTMKRGAMLNGTVHIDHTVERAQLWHALTPQVFRFGALKKALTSCLENGVEVTDEASAMEHLGVHPLLIEGRADNIKVTRPEDLALAEFFLTQGK